MSKSSFTEEEEEMIAEDVVRFESDPRGWADYAYEWGEGELEGEQLRHWQGRVLDYIGTRLQNPKTRYQPIRIAVASGHGIGKSAEIGIIINWAMSTCIDTKVIYTANTATQLRTKTTPEINKWNRLSITGHWFKDNATSLHSVEKGREQTWRADAVTWSAHNTEAFAGAHNKRKRIVIVFDEASSIDDKVWEVTEGALTDENTEIIWIAFGNPTRNSGRFRECFRKFRSIWKTFQIDSRNVEGTNKTLFEEWERTYGIDSDFFKVRVRGLFPDKSLKQFISTEDVDKAFGKHLNESQYSFAPKILTVDPAWEGDDEFVIGLRQGLMFRILGVEKKNDNDGVMASAIARFEDTEQADAVFIDAGYGTGLVSFGRTLGRTWRLVWFAGESNDKGCLNKRAEMWKLGRDWLKDGGALPNDVTLRDELIAPETVSRVDGKIQLESKKDMKGRGVPSPNRADALMLSFAFPVAKKTAMNRAHGEYVNRAKTDYDPRERD